MSDYGLVLSEIEPGPEFGNYNSFDPAWCDSSHGDIGSYGQILSSSQEWPYIDYSSLHEEADDRTEFSYSGSKNMLGCCVLYFFGYWGEDVYSDKGCEAYGSSLDKEEKGEEELGSVYTSNNDMQLDYGEDRWSSFGGFSFGFGMWRIFKLRASI